MGTSATPGVGTVVGAGLSPQIGQAAPALGISDVQRVAISADAEGANTLVDGVAGARIRVVSLVLVASGGTNTAQLVSEDSGVALTGEMDLANNGQFILPYQPAGWCEAGTGEALILNLSDAALVGGMLGYVLAEI